MARLTGLRPCVVIAMFLLLAAPALAAAQVVNCGDTIPAGSKITLTADIGPCSATTADPAVTIVGSAMLDMAGFRLLCDEIDRPTGISLTGKGVKLLRGSIADCKVGLVLGGEGKHKVSDLVVEDSEDDGVQITSDKNKLTHVAANSNGFDGFVVDGVGNKFQQTAATDNSREGYEVFQSGSQFKGDVAADNGLNGFRISGDQMKLKEVTLTRNANNGIQLEGVGSKVEKSLAVKNGDDEDDDAGIHVEGNQHQVKQNRVFDDDNRGILADGGTTGNVISKNVVLGHAADDLVDDNAGGTCGGNSWTKNTFGGSIADGNASPACIK